MFDASNFPTDFGQWTHEQRVQKSYLSEEKVQLLNCLQFDWAAPSRSPSVPWHVMYQELMHYLKRIAPHTRQFDGTPNTKLLQKNGASEHLIAWSKTQQVRYRRVQEKKKNGDDVTANGFRGMPTWQIQLLRDVNFDFDTTLETQWMEKYHLLAAYIKEHGNMKVKRDSKLGVWILGIYRGKEKYSKERIDLLNTIGFDWNDRFRRPGTTDYVYSASTTSVVTAAAAATTTETKNQENYRRKRRYIDGSCIKPLPLVFKS